MAGSHGAQLDSELNAIYRGLARRPERKLLLHARSNVVYAAGHLLYVRDGQLLAQPFDPDRLELTGDPVRVLPTSATREASSAASSAPREGGVLAWMDAPGDSARGASTVRRQRPLARSKGEPALYQAIRFSPDGDRIAMAIQDPADLWILDLTLGIRHASPPTR